MVQKKKKVVSYSLSKEAALFCLCGIALFLVIYQVVCSKLYVHIVCAYFFVSWQKVQMKCIHVCFALKILSIHFLHRPQHIS